MKAGLQRSVPAVMLAVLMLGCPAPEPTEGIDLLPPPEVTALFVVPRPSVPQNYFDTPFPNDLRRDPLTGRPLLEGWPEAVNVPILRNFLALFGANDGFGLNSSLYFRFDGVIDAARLPSPAGTDGLDSPVLLVDVDPDSPELGRLLPLFLDFRAAATIPAYRPESTLAILPVPGFPLREGGRYAAVVTTRITDLAGRPIRRAPDMEAVLSADPADDPLVEAAREMYAPAIDTLETVVGLPRDSVAAMTVFTTMHATYLAPLLREAVYAAPAPEPIGLRYHSGTGETRVFVGSFLSPDFQKGEPPYSTDEGYLLLDHFGTPQVEELDELRFAISVPDVPPSHGGPCYPIVLYNHGTGGDYLTFVGTFASDESEVLGSRGLAVISLDQPLHGDRGDSDVTATLGTFDFTNPRASLVAMLQAAADNFQMVRLFSGAAERPLVIPPALDPDGVGACFDPSMILFMGHSQGSLSGPPFLAFEPLVRAAVLSAAGGGIQRTLIERDIPLPNGGSTPVADLVAQFLNTTPESLNVYHPVLNVIAMAIDPVEPMNFGRLFLRPPPGIPPKGIHLTEGMNDMFTPPMITENLATAIGLGVAFPPQRVPVGISLYGPPLVELPTTGNLGGSVTAVLVQYPGGNHFAIYTVANAWRRYGEFLRTFTLDGVGTVPD